MKLRVLADEDFPFPVVEELRRRGHEILTVQDLGKANQSWPDRELFIHAISDKRTILTRNRRHLYKLHQLMHDHQGIIACTYDPDIANAADQIEAAIRSLRKPIESEFIRVYQK